MTKTFESRKEFKPIDYSFADSFLDYDSLNDWIDELSSPVMADAQTLEVETQLNPPVEKSVSIVDEVQPILQACGKATDLNCIIEKEMSKVSLVAGSGGLVTDGRSTGTIESKSQEDDVESDVESEGTSSASMSSSSSEDENDDEEEDSSSSSSGDSSSDDDDEAEKYIVNAEGRTETGELEEGEIRVVNNEEDESSADDVIVWDGDGEELEGEDEEAGIEAGPISSKNELKNLPPVPPIHATLQPHHQMLPVGAVLSMIGNQVIVEGVEKHNPLNEGSILWITEARSPLGLVDEIFGPVKNPYYSVRYNSESEVPTGINCGTHVSFVLEFSDYVLNNKDLYKKGYDASGANDEEVSDADEFSDDEKEIEFKKMQRLNKRAMNNNQQTSGNKNNARNKKNKAKARKSDQRTFDTARKPDEFKKFDQPSPQPATIPEGNKFDQPTPQQAKMDMVQPSFNQNQQTGPPLAPFIYPGGFPNPSAANQCFMNGTGVMPSFPPMYNPCFTPAMNGIRPAERPYQFQHQQNPFFPNGVPMNGMPWQLQNPAQQVPQMPMPNTFAGVAYPQGFVGTSNPLTSIGAQGIHSGGQPFGQNQNLQPAPQQFNPANTQLATQQFNPANTQPTQQFSPANMQPTQQFNSANMQPMQPFSSANMQPATQQFNPANMQPATQQFNPANTQPPTTFPGNVAAPQQFNQGSFSNQGRGSNGRGGSHFRGRRGGRRAR